MKELLTGSFFAFKFQSFFLFERAYKREVYFRNFLRFLINSIVSVFGINLTFILFFSDFRSRIVSQGIDPYPERKEEGREEKKNRKREVHDSQWWTSIKN